MTRRLPLALALCALAAGCEGPMPVATGCSDEPVLHMTADGVEFVRTPDACFEGLPDWPYEPHYVEIDGLRQAYVDEGPADGPVVLFLHGQPSWSYLYRKMIPVLVEGGFRVIAMDHLGMGRSDKPTDIGAYSYLGHVGRLERFIEELGLVDIHLFCQDWGSLIGLHVVGVHPEWFAAVAVGDGTLPNVPAGVMPYPPVEDPDTVEDLDVPFLAIAPTQPPFYDGCDLLVPVEDGFADWMRYAMKGRGFRPSLVLEALTWFDLPEAEEAAYDAPFPSRIYMAGPRVFPSLINDLPGVNAAARAGLNAYDGPFSTIWAANDPGSLGRCATQDELIASVAGARGWPHVRLAEASHFLQDDRGPQIAGRLVAFFSGRVMPLTRESRYCEILIASGAPGSLTAEVWGTQHQNDCPPAVWEAIDPDAIRAEDGALAVIMNGPRRWLVDRTASRPSEVRQRTFGELGTSLLATVEVGAGPGGPYTATTVRRSTAYFFDAGSEIYELTDPDGVVYVMQAMSMIVDPDLTPADLAGLGARLELPAGWTYAARTLGEPLLLRVEGATVLQDELQNTYQRVVAGGPASMLPVLDDGTGTVCASPAECAGLEASHCLMVSAQGFCTIEGCAAGGCGSPYACCHDCNPAVAGFLPFAGSACIPEARTDQLRTMAGCTCD